MTLQRNSTASLRERDIYDGGSARKGGLRNVCEHTRGRGYRVCYVGLLDAAPQIPVCAPFFASVAVAWSSYIYTAYNKYLQQ